MSQLKEKYQKEVVPFLMKSAGYSNKMAVPRIEKVTLNMGVGKMLSGKSPREREKELEPIVRDLKIITGQKPVYTYSHRSISGFKLRAGSIVGLKVTLRGKRAYDFIERFVRIALPRSRDFRGIDLRKIDRAGNLTLGVKEHIIFPEVSTERAQDIFSFEITITTTASAKEEGIRFLKALGIPLKKEQT